LKRTLLYAPPLNEIPSTPTFWTNDPDGLSSFAPSETENERWSGDVNVTRLPLIDAIFFISPCGRASLLSVPSASK
jgi:hypothetical protein